MSNRKPNIFPGFRYMDAVAAMKRLGEAFGFEQHFLVPGERRTIAPAKLKLGNGLIMLGSAPEEPDPAKRWDTERRVVHVCVEDIDAHCKEAHAAGAEIVRELGDTEYGSREYSACDPEENLELRPLSAAR